VTTIRKNLVNEYIKREFASRRAARYAKDIAKKLTDEEFKDAQIRVSEMMVEWTRTGKIDLGER